MEGGSESLNDRILKPKKVNFSHVDDEFEKKMLNMKM